MRVLIAFLMVTVGVANADDAAKKKAPEWKPPAEMKQLDGLLGTWSCDLYDAGKVVAHATTVNAVDFGGAWMKVTFDAEGVPAGEAPDGSHGEMGWDPQQKKFVFFAAHGAGGWHVSTSSGLEKDRLVFSPVFPKADPNRRSVFVWKDKQHVDILHETKAGKTWKSELGESCTLK